MVSMNVKQKQREISAKEMHTSYDDWLKSNIDTDVWSGEATNADFVKSVAMCCAYKKAKVF